MKHTTCQMRVVQWENNWCYLTMTTASLNLQTTHGNISSEANFAQISIRAGNSIPALTGCDGKLQYDYNYNY